MKYIVEAKYTLDRNGLRRHDTRSFVKSLSDTHHDAHEFMASLMRRYLENPLPPYWFKKSKNTIVNYQNEGRLKQTMEFSVKAVYSEVANEVGNNIDLTA